MSPGSWSAFNFASMTLFWCILSSSCGFQVGSIKNGRLVIPCPQWLRTYKNHFTIWRCKTWSKQQEIPVVGKYSHVNVTRGHKWSTNDPRWRALDPMTPLDINTYVSTFKRHRSVSDVIGSMMGQPRSCCWPLWPRVNLTCGDLLLGRPVVQKHVLHFYIVKWFVCALNHCGHGMTGRPFFDWPYLEATGTR